MDPAIQAVLIIMIIVLGATLAIVGIMFALILRDLRASIQRVNLILEDLRDVSTNFAASSAVVEETVLSIRAAVQEMGKHASPVGSFMGAFSLIRSVFGRGGHNE